MRPTLLSIKRPHIYGLIALMFILLIDHAVASTRRVPSQFSNIQLALDNCGSGDTVLVAPGTYSGPGNHSLTLNNKWIVLQSEEGSEETIVELNYSHRFLSASDVRTTGGEISGFTFRHGRDIAGGAIYTWNASLAIFNCTFIGNSAVRLEPDGYGGAVCAEGGSQLSIRYCEFLQNGGGVGGAVCATRGTTIEMSHCRLKDNSCVVGYGGALAAYDATLEIRNCSLLNNTAYSFGGSIFLLGGRAFIDLSTISKSNGIVLEGGSSLFMSNVTMSDNYGTSTIGAVQLNGYNQCYISNSIIAFSTDGAALQVTGTSPIIDIVCTDIFGNEGGNWVGPIAGFGSSDSNFSADPLFCDRSVYDFALQTPSPCSPELSPCDSLIGATAAACGQVCCQGTTGDINSDFAESANIADLTYLVRWLWRGGPAPKCLSEADVYPDSEIDMADLIYLVGYMFRRGPDPAPCPD